MKKNHPMRGLLVFAFHAASGNASFALLGSIALAAAYLVTGNFIFFSFFLLIAALTFPVLVVASLGSKDGKWERFQLTMPISRNGLLGIQYLSVLVSLIIPVVLVVVMVGLRVFLGRGDFVTGLLDALLPLAMPFLMSSLVFPIACTKIGQGKESGVLTTCQFIAIGILLGAPWVSERIGVSLHMMGALFLAASVLLFIISYFITRMFYAKMDF